MTEAYRIVDILAGGVESSGSTLLGDLYTGPFELLEIPFAFYRGWKS